MPWFVRVVAGRVPRQGRIEGPPQEIPDKPCAPPSFAPSTEVVPPDPFKKPAIQKVALFEPEH